jgi:transcriptional regulator with XRE-family HTH domain
MSFYERFEALCKGKGLRPQSDEIIEMTGVSSPSITGWKKGSAPKPEVLVRIAAYFGVSVDYLLGVEDQNAALMRVAIETLDEDTLAEQEKNPPRYVPYNKRRGAVKDYPSRNEYSR